jgi:hypothetical protein
MQSPTFIIHDLKFSVSMILLPDGRFYSSVLVIYNLYVGAAHLVFCETKYSSH